MINCSLFSVEGLNIQLVFYKIFWLGNEASDEAGGVGGRSEPDLSYGPSSQA